MAQRDGDWAKSWTCKPRRGKQISILLEKEKYKSSVSSFLSINLSRECYKYNKRDIYSVQIYGYKIIKLDINVENVYGVKFYIPIFILICLYHMYKYT